MRFLIPLILCAHAWGQNNAQALLIARPQSAGGGSPALVQGKNCVSTTCAFTSNNTAANLNEVCVEVNFSGTLTFGVSDSQTNTYSQISGGTFTSGGQAITCWHAANIAAGANTVTITTGAASIAYESIVIGEFSGMASSVTANATATPVAGSSTTPAVATMTITAGSLVIGFGVSGGTMTAVSPFVSFGTDTFVMGEWAAPAGTSVTPSFTSANTTWLMIAESLK